MPIQLAPTSDMGNLRHYADAIHRLRICDSRKTPKATMLTITNDMPEAGGGGASAAPEAPVAAASDDPQPDPDPEPRRPSYQPVLTSPELEVALRVRTSALRALTRQPDFPPPIIVGRSKRWIRVEIDRWIEQRAAARKGASK